MNRAEKNVSEDLISELQRKIDGEVRFDRGTRALYASDLSIYRHVPIGVVIPRHPGDVEITVAACRKRSIPILGRGTGTSLAGQTCNVAVILDFSKYMNEVLEINQDEKYAWVEPGVICDQVREAANKDGLTFAPDPATHEYCSIGGMIGNNSCGAHSVMGGKTVDNVEELDILTYDGLHLRVGPVDESRLLQLRAEQGRKGEIFRRLYAVRERYAEQIRQRYPKIPRRVSGYNLDELLPESGFHVARALVGSESTCVLVLKAKLRLIPNPAKRALLVIGYPDIATAADAVPGLMKNGPTALECFNSKVPGNLKQKGREPEGTKFLPQGGAWLLVEFGGDSEEEARGRAQAALNADSTRSIRIEGTAIFEDSQIQKKIWHIRESGVGSSYIPIVEETYPSWEDSAVAPERLGDYLRELLPLIERYNYKYSVFGHFGQGCVHTRIGFGLRTPSGIRTMRSFMEEAADLVVKYGGSLSGEHGDGQARAELLPKMFGNELVQAFQEFKAIWDPDNRMNPGKIVNPYRLDENLRLGADYSPPALDTHFHFPDDNNSFAKATERCFGIGRCRRLEGGTMCPSFRATREEKHTTRGRTRLLFEMMRGEVIKDQWRSKEIREALDLCLSCKGCKGDCPISVDVATYKAEFLSHYYNNRLRPPVAYAMGYIYRWGHLAAWAPWLSNLFLRNKITPRIFGLTPERPMPAFAGETFQKWWEKRGNSKTASQEQHSKNHHRVILWPDTFNNHFHPETSKAAAEALESLSYDVEVPTEHLCCGRPLFDFGLINEARKQLRHVLDVLKPSLRSGVPVIGLEPSCISVFHDELLNLFPEDDDAHLLAAQSYTLPEFIASQKEITLPRLSGKALLHGHCHQKAFWGIQSEQQILEKMGLQVSAPDDGCCGMGGPFGWEQKKYPISMDIGEKVLLPAVREQSEDTLVVADGFSCRTQIENGTNRRPVHLAEVLRIACDTDRVTSNMEQAFATKPPGPSAAEIVACGAAASLIAAGLWLSLRRSKK
jgi:FAD/FMN-containing dehydrogenase/Fe-S oxidoreductase